MKNEPLVSVILPIYNPDKDWLDTAINSVLNQSYENYEVILVNDGSEKELDEYLSPEILKKNSVRAFSQENQGFTGATNTAMKKAEGKYIAPIGQDDIWAKSKIETQVESLNGEKICLTPAEHIDEKGHTTQVSGRYKDSEADIKQKLIQGNFIRYESALISSDILEAEGYLNENFSISSDYELWMRLLPKYEYVYLNEPLVKKRVHTGAGSSNPIEFLNEDKKILKKAFENEKINEDFKSHWSKILRHKGKMAHSRGYKDSSRKLFRKSLNQKFNWKALILLILSYTSVFDLAIDSYSSFQGRKS